MQTFLPYPDFKKSFECLDSKRLGKQRVETHQILNVLSGQSNGWKNHPAVKMWIGYQNCLIEYFNLSVSEWVKRGYKNTYEFKSFIETESFEDPYWLGLDEFHSSHRSNLLRKDPTHYEQFGWTEPNNLPYVWPKPKVI